MASDPPSWAYFGKTGEYMANGTLFEVIKGNMTTGKTAVVLWTYESGRIFQTPALFMLGMLLGRRKMFVASGENQKSWKKILIAAAILFAILFAAKLLIPKSGAREAVAGSLTSLVTSWANFAFTFVLVSSFVLAYQKAVIHRTLTKLEVFGRMSLTNYVMQSVVGTFIYYGFGLGLYKYTGATMCILIGIVLFLLQFVFCRWWMKNHDHGPLEGVWHRLTWI